MPWPVSTIRTFAVVALLAAASHGATSAAQSADAKVDAETAHLVKLERDMWEAWRTRDLKALAALTSPEYVTVNENGRSTWAEVREAFTDVTLQSYTLGEMTPTRVSADVVIITYPAEIKGSYKTFDMSRKVAECSIWRREKGAWRNVFLHEVTVKP